MFWKYNNTSSPHFDKVLQKEGVTLQQLMEEEDIIQECKLQNKKLVDFLCQRNVLEELVTLITEEPSEDLDERSRFKYPNIACELLTCDVPALNESLSRDNELLEKLYSFIDKDPPLNPLLASFLSRTLGVLIVKRIDNHWISYQFTCLQAMGFLKDKENFISLLLKHLGTSAIMDLTLKLITEVGDDEHRQNLLNWLDSQRLVQSLVELFNPKVDSERQHNASQLICDVLRISREVLNDHRDRLYTDPILARLESQETISLLLDQMLGSEKSESSIVGGIQVLLALLGHKNSFNDNNLMYNNAYDEAEVERKQKVAQSTALVILERLKDFHQILLDPPKKPALNTSIGILDPPLGNTRLQVTKLLAALIALDQQEVLREIMRLGIVEVLLDLFFKYVWNNFLHAQVQQCIAASLVTHVKPNESDNENSDNLMYPYLILKCRLLGRILEAWDDNEQKQTKPKGIRQGYMGHLINIANEIVNQCEQNSSLNNYITENVSKDTLEAWNNFVNGSLAETNKTQRVILGGVHPRNLTGDDSSEDYNIPFPQAALIQQQLQNYNDLQMQPDLIENSSIFHADDFTDPDDSRDLSRQAEMLKKVCSDFSNTLDDSDDVIFDEENIPSRTIDRSINSAWDNRGNNNSDEEDMIRNDPRMDVDPWPKMESGGTSIILGEPSNPWASIDTKSTSQEDGWADFGSFATDFTGEQFTTDPFAFTNTTTVTTTTTTPTTTSPSSPTNTESVVNLVSTKSVSNLESETPVPTCTNVLTEVVNTQSSVVQSSGDQKIEVNTPLEQNLENDKKSVDNKQQESDKTSGDSDLSPSEPIVKDDNSKTVESVPISDSNTPSVDVKDQQEQQQQHVVDKHESGDADTITAVTSDVDEAKPSSDNQSTGVSDDGGGNETV